MVTVETVLLIAGVLLRAFLWTVGGAALLLAVAACVPVKIDASVAGLAFREDEDLTLDGITGRFGLTWLFGWVALQGVQEPGKAARTVVRLFGHEKPLRDAGSGRRWRRRERAAGSGGHPRGAAIRRSGKKAGVPEQEAGRAEAEQSATKDRGQEGTPEGSRSKKGRKRSQRLTAADVRALVPEGARMLSRLWRASHVQARGELTYGFSDPCLTGWFEAGRAVVLGPSGLKLTPDFSAARLEGWVEVQAKAYPVVWLWIVVTTLLRRPVRRIVRRKKAQTVGPEPAG